MCLVKNGSELIVRFQARNPPSQRVEIGIEDVSKSNLGLILRRSFAKKRRFWLIYGAFRAALDLVCH